MRWSGRACDRGDPWSPAGPAGAHVERGVGHPRQTGVFQIAEHLACDGILGPAFMRAVAAISHRLEDLENRRRPAKGHEVAEEIQA